MAEIDDYEKIYGKGSASKPGGNFKRGKKKKSSGSHKKSSKKSSGGSSKGSSSSSSKDNEKSYAETMADSVKLEEIPEQRLPNHVDHLSGSLAKYGMSNISARSGYIKVTLDTISGTYPLVPRQYSHYLPDGTENKLISDLISVQVQNDMQNDIPTCTFILGNQLDWSSVLSVNDLIRVDYVIPYKPGDRNGNTDFGGSSDYADFSKVKHAELPDDPNYDKANAIYQQAPDPPKYSYNNGNWVRCLYTGLVSNLTRNASYSGNQETYTVVGQGMAKILSNIQLSTFTDLQSNLNGYQLLPDDEKTGIGFKGHTSANIVKQIINRFVLQNQGGVNTYDYLASQQGEDITTRASAVTAGLVNDFMKGPMTEEQYDAYMQALADAQTSDSSKKSDDSDSNS